MAAKLKIIEDVADIVPPPVPQPIDPVNQSDRNCPDFAPAPTRKRHAGWTAERQRKFIEHLALSGCVGEACALVGVASSSAYRLRDRAGADSFARAWDAALQLTPTRLSAIAFDRAINGRVERFYKDGELVMERRMPSDFLLTWLLSRLDPLRFGSPNAKAHAAATGDPRARAAAELPGLLDRLDDVPPEDCEVEPIDYLDERLGETGTGAPIEDHER